MNDKRNIIYDKCFNTVNDNFADEIDDLIENIINEQRNNHISHIRDLKEEQENKINKILSELEKEKEQSETQRIIRRSIPLIRQFMNIKFRELFNNLSEDIKNKYNTCDTSFIKRKNILNDDGVKYAVLVINNICNDVLKKTCDFYLKINDDFHPNTNPANIIIHECIEKLKKHIKYSSIDIDVLNEIDKLCLQ